MFKKMANNYYLQTSARRRVSSGIKTELSPTSVVFRRSWRNFPLIPPELFQCTRQKREPSSCSPIPLCFEKKEDGLGCSANTLQNASDNLCKEVVNKLLNCVPSGPALAIWVPARRTSFGLPSSPNNNNRDAMGNPSTLRNFKNIFRQTFTW